MVTVAYWSGCAVIDLIGETIYDSEDCAGGV